MNFGLFAYPVGSDSLDQVFLDFYELQVILISSVLRYPGLSNFGFFEVQVICIFCVFRWPGLSIFGFFLA